MKSFFHKHLMILAPIGMLVLVAIDQITKALAVRYLKGKEAFVIWDGVFEFHYFENTGAAWGMLQNKQILFYILTVIFCVAVMIEVCRLYKESRYTPFVYTLFLVLAGALGNFIDRILNQYVVDFLYFKLIDFPIFNLADCYITVAVILMMLLILFYYKDEEFEYIFPGISSKKKKEQVEVE